ncbi:MAG: glycoside hydrolase family 76 protein [Fimbriimonadales bacterium]
MTGKNSYLTTAKNLYAWLAKLTDSDGLMLDHIDLSGKIERTKWTYNSALTVEAGASLFQITGDRKYLSDAKRTAEAAKARWIDPIAGAIKDEAAFAHHLADAFLALGQVDRGGDWGAVARRSIEFAYSNTGKDGLFGSRWDRYAARDSKFILLWQASMARGLLRAANNHPVPGA